MTTGQYDGQSNEMFYVDGGDGKYLEVRKPDGSFEYVRAEPGLQFREIQAGPNMGKYLAVRSEDEARRQAAGQSHANHFGKMLVDGELKTADPRVARQKLKRLDAIERQLATAVLDRATPGASPNVRTIKDSEFERLHAEYKAAVAAGRPHESSFVPLTVYARKLITSSGKILRHAFAGECGMQGDTILILEQGYGTGNLVPVSEAIERDQSGG